MDDTSSIRLNCPGCAEALDIPAEAADQLTRCPYCSTQFFASLTAAHLDIVDDTDEAAQADKPPELDGNRIRQLAAMRRGAIRARSWCWIATTVAAAAAMQLVVKAVQNVVHTRSITPRAVGFVLFAGLGVWFAMLMWRAGRKLSVEINAPRSAEDAPEPDFSTLSDGSQRWTNLEDIH